LEGAVAYISFAYLVDLLFHYFVAQKLYFKNLGIDLKGIINASFRSDFVKELFYFSGFGITVGTYSIFSELTCRSIVITNLGIDQIGLYSPIIMWSSMLTGFLLPALSSYLYPRFCELKERHEITGLLNNALRLGTIVLLPLLFLGIPFRNIVISFIYSKEFLSATIYLPFHFIGLIFYVWFYIFTQAMTPTGRIRQHGIFQIMYFSLDIFITYCFVKRYGLYGYMLKHIISPFIFLCIYGLYSYNKIGFRLSKENLILMGYLLLSSSILISLIFFFIHGNQIVLFLGPIMLISSFFFLNKEERKYVDDKLLIIKKKLIKTRNLTS
jgi:O-antigen/teichoic acid export membrane protein